MIIKPAFLTTLSNDELSSYLGMRAIPARFMLAATVEICNEGNEMSGMFGRIEHVIPASGDDGESFIVEIYGTGERICRTMQSFKVVRSFYLDT